MTRTRSLLLLAAALTIALTACGSDSKPTSAAAGGANDEAFVLNEWTITPPTSTLHAGKVKITAHNIGSETHELVIIRTSDAASLPKKADGSIDEDKIPEADKPGEIPDVAMGKTVTKTIDLAAGDYIAICNLVDKMGTSNSSMHGGTTMMGDSSAAGHIHFHLGMVVAFTVK